LLVNKQTKNVEKRKKMYVGDGNMGGYVKKKKEPRYSEWVKWD
jgi:topoisomerase IA-like protein